MRNIKYKMKGISARSILYIFFLGLALLIDISVINAEGSSNKTAEISRNKKNELFALYSTLDCGRIISNNVRESDYIIGMPMLINVRLVHLPTLHGKKKPSADTFPSDWKNNVTFTIMDKNNKAVIRDKGELLFGKLNKKQNEATVFPRHDISANWILSNEVVGELDGEYTLTVSWNGVNGASEKFNFHQADGRQRLSMAKARVLMKKKDYKMAIKKLLSIHEKYGIIKDSNESSLELLGLAYARTDQHADAYKVYDEVIKSYERKTNADFMNRLKIMRDELKRRSIVMPTNKKLGEH